MSESEVTILLRQMRDGRDSEAVGRLMPLVYQELRRLAGHYMKNERADHTLQPTALVHEAYIKLVNDQFDWQNRAHFIGVAAQAMRRILVDHAREQNASKRGGDQAHINLDDAFVLSPERGSELVALDDALDRLERVDARQSRIVELRFFGGLSVEEIAEVTQLSPRTVKRDWSVARAWLHRQVTRGHGA